MQRLRKITRMCTKIIMKIYRNIINSLGWWWWKPQLTHPIKTPLAASTYIFSPFHPLLYQPHVRSVMRVLYKSRLYTRFFRPAYVRKSCRSIIDAVPAENTRRNFSCAVAIPILPISHDRPTPTTYYRVCDADV